MKLINIVRIPRTALFLLVAVIALGSCKKYLAVNVSPNNPTAVPPSVLLPTTEIGVGFVASNDLCRATSALTQQIAGTANQTQGYDVFNFSGAFDNQWNNELYDGIITNCRQLVNLDSAASPAYSGIAKIEMAYAFSVAADIWGDVPYSQAGFGLTFLNPRFDKVQDIYQGNSSSGIVGLIDLVKSGIADLSKPSTLKPKADDIMYGGDLTKWARVGNTLLLKFAIMMTNVNPALAKSTITDVLTGNNYINSTSLDFEIPFSSSTGNQNAYYTFNYVNRPGDQMLSSRFLALMQGLNDTLRLAKFFTKPNGVFTGFNNGSSSPAPLQATRSQYGTYLIGTTGNAPVRILTWFQVNFILAEAALVLGTPGNANAYYQAGIQANMLKVGMLQSDITAYFAANPSVVTLSGTPQQMLQQIMTQKYIAWCGNGIETFDDYRRTGYPALALPLNPGGDDPTVIPTRLPYTIGETNANPNTPNPRPLVNVKLWWAK